MEKVVLYTTHCPKCRVLETKLKQKGIEYEECSDVNLMISKGIKSAPFLEVDGELMEFGKAVKYINEAGM